MNNFGLADLLFLVGMGCVSYGLYRLDLTTALVFVGITLMVLSILGAVK